MNILNERDLFLRRLGFNRPENSHLYYINLKQDGVRLVCNTQLDIWFEYADIHSVEENCTSVGIGRLEPENFGEMLKVLAKLY
jgi:hypothetical protein